MAGRSKRRGVMPSAHEILQGLSTAANTWTFLAVFWHAYFAALLVPVLLGWRPSQVVVGTLLASPLASVSVLAWVVGNPFNGAIFALLFVALMALILRRPLRRMELTSPAWIVIGAALFVFAWIYPHFLEGRPLYSYLYLAPLGLIPCPTLSMMIGMTILLGGVDSRAWTLVVGAAGIFYGIFGSLRLGVTIDWALTAGALCLLAQGVQRIRRGREGAT